MLRIVHLSDFHLNYEHQNEFREFTMKALLRDLIEFDREKKIDLVMFTGDLIDKGGLSFNKDIDLAFYNFNDDVIEPILYNLNLSKDRFLFIPGNHDIDRNTVNKIYEAGLRQTLQSTESVNDFVQNIYNDGVERLKSFKGFEKQYFEGSNKDYKFSNFSSTYKLTINKLNVGVACVNSAWRCFDSNEDKEKILISERQLMLARQEIEECDLKIALVHHPLDWLAPFDSIRVEEMITKDFDMMLCGHVHSGKTSSKTTMLGSLFVSVAPSNWSHNLRSTDRDNSNGYTIIDYTDSQIITHNRRYNHPKESFDPNTDLGDKDGKNYYLVPNNGEIEKREIERSICQNIKNVHFLSRNEHLLSYKTDTLAPKSVEDIFVLPRLINKTQYDAEKKDSEQIYDLEKLCELKNHSLLIGDKESGKTILLDRLLIELTNNLDKYNQIPVYIDLDEVRTSRIETDISRFLHIAIHDVERFLNDHHVTLLIDNLTPTYNRSYKIKEIEHLTSKYEKLRIVATCSSLMSGELPIELLEFDVIATFETIRIEAFRTRQIKLLTQKWFSKNDQYKNLDNIEEIIKLFTKLNIPRTPMAVSMLLWIIEYQENYKPVNNATMLENFIERLFRKHATKEIYSEEFDFTNKQRLLADIALQMYQGNLENYKIPSKTLYSFIFDYLKARKFLFRVEDVLQEFLQSGVLTEEDGESELFVRFRFGCFFKYFLMKNMDYKPEFKEFVLHEDNYLKFEDEIEYFTGLKRDQADILKILVDRMINKFEPLLQYYGSKLGGFDLAFATDKSVLTLLDGKFIDELTDAEKPTEDDIDSFNDNALENIDEERGITKKEEHELSKLQELERSWTLTAKVLKNTEETDDGALKSRSYNDLLNCSSAFATMYKLILKNYFEKKDVKFAQSDDELDMLYKVLPLSHQIATFGLVGTAKLSVVMKEDIINKLNLNPDQFTDFEKFLSVFIYSDLKGPEYLGFISKLIKNVKQAYIHDMILFKLVTYYFFRAKNEALDLQFLNLIGDLMVKVKGDPKTVKSKIFEDYKLRRAKKLKSLNSDDVDDEAI